MQFPIPHRRIHSSHSCIHDMGSVKVSSSDCSTNINSCPSPPFRLVLHPPPQYYADTNVGFNAENWDPIYSRQYTVFTSDRKQLHRWFQEIKSLLRSCRLLNYSRSFPHFVEHKRSWQCLPEPVTSPLTWARLIHFPPPNPTCLRYNFNYRYLKMQSIVMITWRRW